MKNIFKIFNVLLFLFMLIAISFIPNGNSSLNTYYVSKANPFIVHNVSGAKNYTVFLDKGIYFIDISANTNSNLSFTIKGENLNFSMWDYSIGNIKSYEFHGIVINYTDNYNITTKGNGSWVLSLNAQSYDNVYSYNISNSETFVLVPETIPCNEISIQIINSSPIKVEVFNSVLQNLSYIKNKDGSILVNVNSNNKIIFLTITGNGTIKITWYPIKNSGENNSNESNSLSTLYLIGILIIIILILALLMSRVKGGNNKK